VITPPHEPIGEPVGGAALVAWIAAPTVDRGIRFALAGDEWDVWSYARLALETRRVAAGLTAAGVRRGDVVCITARTGPAFVTAFFGSLLAGTTPAPVAPPFLFESAADYATHVARVLTAARPAIVVTESAEACDEIRTLPIDLPRVDAIDDVRAALPIDATVAAAAASALPAIGLLQFTSGSSASSRGVRVTCAALAANVTAIRTWLRWTEDVAFASWLPLHHDMGLIGALVCAVTGQRDLWLMQPAQFVRQPARYLRCFGRHGAALSVMPTFGLDHIIRRVTPSALAGCDFSRWHGLVIGAERVDASTLDRFTTLLAPFGFSRLALAPAYGLAEATLAVTGVPLDESWSAIDVAPASLSLGQDIVLAREGQPRETIVGCGRPLGGASIAIVDAAGAAVPDGRVGEIVVRGPSVAAGYADARNGAATALADGTLITGDAGFVRDGQLFVLGRLGDSLKVRGRVVFGEELELAVAALGVPRARVAALLGVHHGQPTAVIVIERFHGSADAVRALIRLHAGDVSGVVLDAPAGTIARTTSGKPKRRQLWHAFTSGTLPGMPI